MLLGCEFVTAGTIGNSCFVIALPLLPPPPPPPRYVFVPLERKFETCIGETDRSRAVEREGFRDVSKLSTFRIINSRSFSFPRSKVNWFPVAIGKSLFRCCFCVRKQPFFFFFSSIAFARGNDDPDVGKEAREISPSISSTTFLLLLRPLWR